jgi:uncharacterized protein YecE (DUF72 family)
MIEIGTSGFDYEDWRGFFYPESLNKTAWLEYYASHFSALELNFSYYRMPDATMLASMVRRTDGKVTFVVKAHRSMTHERTASDLDFAAFRDALQPIREANRLGAVLAQFPNSFRQCEENRMYLKRLVERLGTPSAVELRRDDWAVDPIAAWLKKIGVGYVCVDEPRLPGLMPPTATVAAAPAYVRFHGRNADKWYTHNRPEERYDYRYAVSELKEWSFKIRALERKAGHVLVFFNNHFQGKAVEAAKMMERLLQETEGS